MFGIGFTELILISIIAILFLGPDKLPQAMVDMAKFIKSVKKTITEAKGSLEEELKISDLKEEALGYKKQLDDATSELSNFKNIDFDDFDDDDVTYDEEISTKSSKELATKSDSYDSDKITPVAEEETVATKVEQKQDENVALKKKPKKAKNEKSKVAKNEANEKTTKDTPKDNA